MDLSGRTWVVTHLDDGDGRLGETLVGTTLTFAYDGERVNGTAGCNNYFGPASLDSAVRIGPLATTLMMCHEPEGVMEQEQRFLRLLGEIDAVEANQDRLELRRGERAVVVLVPLPVELGGSWSLLFYNNGREALVSPIPDTEITAIFETGRLRGHSGCNRYTTTYQADAGSLRIPPPAGTRMLCSEPPGLMEQEARYLELLPSTNSYLLRDGRILELFDRAGARILQFSRN